MIIGSTLENHPKHHRFWIQEPFRPKWRKVISTQCSTKMISSLMKILKMTLTSSFMKNWKSSSSWFSDLCLKVMPNIIDFKTMSHFFQNEEKSFQHNVQQNWSHFFENDFDIKFSWKTQNLHVHMILWSTLEIHINHHRFQIKEPFRPKWRKVTSTQCSTKVISFLIKILKMTLTSSFMKNWKSSYPYDFMIYAWKACQTS